MGIAWSPTKESAVSTSPIVAKGRAPWRSARRPATGAATKKPTVSGSM